MPGENEVQLANPLDSGANEHSVESAAADFTRMLQDEEKPRRSEPARNNRSRRSEPEPEDNSGSDAPDPDEEDDGQRSQEPSDEILDHVEDGDPDEEDEGQDEDDTDDENDGDEDENGDDDDGDDIDWGREVTVDLGDGEQSLKLGDLRDGYMREADYRRKTANLAEERREVVEFANETVAERKHYQETITTFLEIAEAIQPSEKEMAELKTKNPELYYQVRDQWDAVEKHRASARAELEKAQQAEANEKQREYREWVNSENKKLAEKLPALADPKKARNFSKAIMNYAKSAGYSQEELMMNAVDHRDVLTLYKAAKYDEIMQSRKAGQRKTSPGPKPAPSSQPRNIAKTGRNNRSLRNADRRAARSGSVNDAASAFTEMLNG